MRKIVALLSLLLLSACGSQSVAIEGEVVSCANLKTIANPTTKFPTQCLDGSEGVNIAAIKGPAIINVWGSWCAPCKDELPFFVEFHRDFGSKVQLVGLDVEERSPADGRKFAIAQGMAWPNLYDSEGNTRKYFGMGVPVTWFIDANGKVRHKKIGVIKSANELRELSKKYLGVA